MSAAMVGYWTRAARLQNRWAVEAQRAARKALEAEAVSALEAEARRCTARRAAFMNQARRHAGLPSARGGAT